MSFVELAARSAFSLLEGASTPESLAERAAVLKLPALGLADHFDLGGVVRFTRVCARHGVQPILGAELRCGLPRTNLHELRWLGRDSPGAAWARLILLCIDRHGYHALSALITRARLENPRGEPALPLDALLGKTTGLVCLVNVEEWGSSGVSPACDTDGKTQPMAGTEVRMLDELHGWFGDRLFLALAYHGLPEEARRCRAWIAYAEQHGISWVPTNMPRYARPSDRIVHDVLTCLRYRTTLDEAGDRLLPNGEWYLKSAAQMRARWCRYRPARSARESRLTRGRHSSLTTPRNAADRPFPPRLPRALPSEPPRGFAPAGSPAGPWRPPREGAAPRSGGGRGRREDVAARSAETRGAARAEPVGEDCECEGCRALRRTVQIAELCRFRLTDLEPELPAFPVPGSRSADDFLGGLVEEGVRERYGDRAGSRHRHQIEHELRVIRKLKLADYFLIMWDIVRFARRRGILVQGRGSAANSAVCYCLGITAVDPIGLDLLFERFLSEERDEAPDIDLDIAHQDREEVLQYVYETYGRAHAAMVCETITYRGRMAVRDVARVLGFPTEVANALSLEADRGEAVDAARRLAEGGAHRAGLDPEDPRTRALIRAVAGLNELPRHRSIHVGGFVITARPIGEVVPVEAASMPARTVIQWDKDDLDLPGLIKVDLLGLGMLTVLGKAIAHVRHTRGVTLDLAHLPPDDPAVYDMICAADTVGVFQIESRAQMNTLPRVQPRCFYDLVIEVALIRPGPIQGDMVHPYLRRRRGEEPVTYLDPRLEPVLKRTLGVPLFQEQGMKVAVTLAGYTPAQADRLRRAMGFKRSRQAMEQVGVELAEGLERNGVRPEVAAQIFKQLTAFANYGFPESHAASFALLVYASAYLKRYYAPEFFCALLNAQPMGFYSPATLLYDAQRHGVEVRPVDLALSEWDSTLEVAAKDDATGDPLRELAVASNRGSLRESPVGNGSGSPITGMWGVPRNGRDGRNGRSHGSGPREHPGRAGVSPAEQQLSSVARERTPALRLGLRLVRGLGEQAREKLKRARASGPFTSVEDVVRRSGLGQAELRTLAEAGAFETLWPGRREALWELLRQLRGDAGPLAPRPVSLPAPPMPRMAKSERVLADYRTLGLSVEGHPMEFLREELKGRRVLSAADLRTRQAGDEVSVAGIPICRQRPHTAKGVMFITLEDETGFSNFVVMHDVQERYWHTILRSPVLLLEGVVEREQGVINVLTRRAVDLAQDLRGLVVQTRDFR